jgi:hypothetical protein
MKVESTTTESALSLGDAIDRLVIQPEYDDGKGPRLCVHTILGGLGAHWGLSDIIEAMVEHGVEDAGPTVASSVGHTLVIQLGGRLGSLYVEARPPKEAT